MTISKLAKEINVCTREIYRIVRRDKLTTVMHDKNIKLTFEQCNYITRVMFFERKMDYITLESKMNVKQSFTDFKNQTYN